MAERTVGEYRSGDALFTFDSDLCILTWNQAAESLTGVPAGEAVGRRCWEILGGTDEDGATVCHAGCSYARLAQEGWPVPVRRLAIKTTEGTRSISLSTVATVKEDDCPLLLHLMFEDAEPSNLVKPAPDQSRPHLTPRQREVLELLGEGVPAKMIAARLGLSERTVRNHIRGILLQLGAHSQLAAVAEARRLGMIGKTPPR